MEFLPGLHRLSMDLGGLPLDLWMLVGEGCVLVDSGTSTAPSEVIVPYMATLGLDSASIVSVIVTHAHDDHCGGNASLKGLNSEIEIVAHALDAPWIEDHVLQFSELFRVFEGILPGIDGFEAPFFEMIGDEVGVDRLLQGGETLSWIDGSALEIVNTPGHTLGHIAVYDRQHRWAVVADAVQCRGLRLGEGPTYWPLYVDVDAYLGTLQTLRGLEVDHLLTSHFGHKWGDEVAAFIDQSEEFVRRAESDLLDILRRSQNPLSLSEVGDRLLQRWPEYQMSLEVLWASEAHLERLASQGRAMKDEAGWRLTE